MSIKAKVSIAAYNATRRSAKALDSVVDSVLNFTARTHVKALFQAAHKTEDAASDLDSAAGVLRAAARKTEAEADDMWIKSQDQLVAASLAADELGVDADTLF